MEDMQSQMNAILGNPDMMQKIMAMAQSLGQGDNNQQQKQEAPLPSLPNIDPSLIQKFAGLAGQSSIDSNQRTLLKALTPYLNKDRIAKLERAMRAAKMANMASGLLSRSGYQFHPGR